MQIKVLLLAVISLLTVAACKHNHDEDDNKAPVLTIDEPLVNDTISGEVHIEGDVTDESLHEMEIKINLDSDGSELFKVAPDVHDEKAFHFHEHWMPTISVETAVSLTITVEDHKDNTTIKTVKFTIKP